MGHRSDHSQSIPDPTPPSSVSTESPILSYQRPLPPHPRRNLVFRANLALLAPLITLLLHLNEFAIAWVIVGERPTPANFDPRQFPIVVALQLITATLVLVTSAPSFVLGIYHNFALLHDERIPFLRGLLRASVAIFGWPIVITLLLVGPYSVRVFWID